MKRLAVALALFLTLCNITIAQFNGCPAGFCGPAIPAFVINQANPPDLAFNWVTNQAWNKSTGVSSTASSLITTVRAAPAAYVNDAQGNWTAINANLPRLSNLGLLVEESRINSIRNNSAQGAVPGTPGTKPNNYTVSPTANLTTNIIAVGTQLGIDYFDVQIIGTTDATGFYELLFEGTQIIAAVNAQTWTPSAFAAIVGGSTTNISNITFGYNENDASGVALTSHPGANISGSISATLTRTSAVLTNTNASTAFVTPYLSLNFGTSVAINITIRIGWPQLELGASATSPIRTTSAAVTRAADVISLTTPPTFGSAYSLYAKGTPQTPIIYSIDQVFMQVDDGTGNNRTSIRRNGGGGGAYMPSTAAGVSNTSSVSGAAWAQNTSGKLAGAMASGDQNSAFNAVLLGAQMGTLPATPTNVRVGSIQIGAAQWNGFLEYSAIWATQRVSNSELQSMTTP